MLGKSPRQIFSKNKMRTNRLGNEGSIGFSGKNFCKSFGKKNPFYSGYELLRRGGIKGKMS